jgi:hypothetical protein
MQQLGQQQIIITPWKEKRSKFVKKIKFLLFITSQVHKNMGLYPKSSLATVSITTPNIIVFSLL